MMSSRSSLARKLFSLAIFMIPVGAARAGTLSVITSTMDLAAIVQEVGGEFVKAESICRGTQDPHSIEPKPSFMVKALNADLVVAIGLSLEIGWLPSILQGSRNPKIQTGQNGYLEVGPSLNPLEKATGVVSRAQGDVHPDGNPHVTLDPIRVGQAALLIATRLGSLDAAHAGAFKTNAEALQKRMTEKTQVWQTRLDKTSVKKIITFHKTLTYFLDRFKIENPAILEPLPGIPPTPSHTIEIIQIAKAQKIPLIMVENFFSSDAAQRVIADVPGMRFVSVPVSVEGSEEIKTIDDLFERLVSVIEGKN